MWRKLPCIAGTKERALIVAKTHMHNGACVSGLTLETNRNIRLLTATRSHQPEDTPYNIGDVWALEYRRMASLMPPHVEDVRILNSCYIGQQSNVSKILLGRVQPWRGGPQQLYNGFLVLKDTYAYICRSRSIPECSTGFWLPDQPLTLIHKHGKAYYQIPYRSDRDQGRRLRTLHIPYVGFGETIAEIPAHTLVRVSLARWRKFTEQDEEKCYLQLSGWYL